jgi:GNAT superfamily N-acetyltransferase
MHLRDARPADAARLAEIHAVSWQTAYRGVLSDAFLDGLTSTSRLDWWTARLARVPPRWAILVVEDDSDVTGFATLGHCEDDDRRVAEAGELFAMYVDPADWGRGYGRKLLLGGEARFRQTAFSNASLWVLEGNLRARRFYEVGGWFSDGTLKRMVIGAEAVTACRYLRDLKQP